MNLLILMLFHLRARTLRIANTANIKDNVVGALHAPTGGIVGPYEYTIALMENGIKNGGKLELKTEVKNIEKVNDIFKITSEDGKVIEAKYVINAAGVHADT